MNRLIRVAQDDTVKKGSLQWGKAYFSVDC